jgi:hypothetical protein
MWAVGHYQHVCTSTYDAAEYGYVIQEMPYIDQSVYVRRLCIWFDRGPGPMRYDEMRSWPFQHHAVLAPYHLSFVTLASQPRVAFSFSIGWAADSVCFLAFALKENVDWSRGHSSGYELVGRWSVPRISDSFDEIRSWLFKIGEGIVSYHPYGTVQHTVPGTWERRKGTCMGRKKPRVGASRLRFLVWERLWQWNNRELNKRSRQSCFQNNRS